MNSRKNIKHKKKKKVLKKVLLILLLTLIAIVGYAVFQYYQGLQKSDSKSNMTETYAPEEFKGEKDINGKINVLLLGVDSRGEEKSRTDTIMVAQYDPEDNSARLVSIMRDTYVEIPDHKNYKINTANFLGGPELLRQTLKLNFDLDVQYYALIDFEGFAESVDALAPEGIEINVEKEMSKNIDVTLYPGLQKLNGKELLDFARFRHDAEGDFGRVKRQQQVINALKDELISFNGATKLPKMIGTIQPYFVTNMDTVDFLSLAKEVVLNPPAEIETLRIPIDNSYTNESYEHAGSVLEIDKEINTQALKDFLSGKPINETSGETLQTEENLIEEQQ
ncbi:LCP family protein [Bacillus weihaiensis]|uniref:Regulatory protein MsrR n=1 Tax=Bacillus weihaiensis TaxID=1547283 RepID=A0A1L3MMR8_9BACI|nr:LCP family protein [Bacillus weihaiensis]APH03554.1 transcriptional regulator [Bacillus weihaiensis]